MAIQTNIRIVINGEQLTKFSKIAIVQSLCSHHVFSIKQPLPKDFIDHALDKAQGYMGQIIHIAISPRIPETSGTLTFKGLVTDVDVDRSRGAAGEMVISGSSPTIQLDGVPNTHSWLNKELSEVVSDTLGRQKESLGLQLNPDRDTALDYTVQYGESDFGFLCRLAQKKGQWCYYNGTRLVFGRPKPETFSLVYGRNISRFKRHMGIKPLGFSFSGYDPEGATVQKLKATEIGLESQGLTQAMLEISKRIFPDTGASMHYNHPISPGNASGHLHDRVKTQLQGRASGMVTARGTSTEPGLRLGDIASITEPKFSLTGDPADGVRESAFGRYYITRITHICDETGNYSNEFEGVPDTVEAPPYTNVLTPPVAETQPAIVTDNNDPKGLGRVKVKFHWDYESPWIRMVQPHGGGSKGFYFIPEVGEEVLVAFEGGNAEKPYVAGTMYNGSQVSGYATENNDLKVIHSRSGTKIKMNDAEGSIFIEDPSGNTWFMDGQGNIEVTAPKNVSIRAGEHMTLTAGRSITTNSGEDTSITAGKNLKEVATADYRLQAANITEISDGDFRAQADTINNVGRSEITSMSNEGALNSHARSKINNNSGEKGNLF
ncbi:type VI secretion system Vgr family protein [Sinomicrobium soli]|uniref:type VI secretion system Vgr family protein n=1 Tax=Sinomicrobium sp. N-1-3-6 TaxID=2219864 RepID=UPI000DCD9112|nr:type VI secretion system Vgr family protein [Sinomicrobium sp. N-1-3-6]RAV30772.1 hypothetical protein DN748_00490 [Sinomicrobium sp. N-1-3-6]